MYVYFALLFYYCCEALCNYVLKGAINELVIIVVVIIIIIITQTDVKILFH